MFKVRSHRRVPMPHDVPYCWGPGKALHQFRPPGFQISLLGHRNRRLLCGMCFCCPKWLQFSLVTCTFIHSHRLSNLPMSLAFCHLRRTCISWFFCKISRNQSNRCLLSSAVTPLMCFTWPPTGKTLFQPETGFVRTTGWTALRILPMFFGLPRGLS